MSCELDITARAKRDIHRISDWYLTESNSVEVASKWYNGIQKALKRLKDNPESFSLAHESDEFPFDLRQLLYGSGKRKTHRALFRIVGNTVEILAVRHLAQRDVSPEDIS